MSHIAWNAIRAVAENISLGDRSYWDLLKIPTISAWHASDAIAVMVQQGVVSRTEYRVEPTEAFDGWLADLRWRDDARTRPAVAAGARRLCRQTGRPLDFDCALYERQHRPPRKLAYPTANR